MAGELKCPECNGARVQVLRDLEENGKPRPFQVPMYACLDCWHKWPLHPGPQVEMEPRERDGR